MTHIHNSNKCFAFTRISDIKLAAAAGSFIPPEPGSTHTTKEEIDLEFTVADTKSSLQSLNPNTETAPPNFSPEDFSLPDDHRHTGSATGSEPQDVSLSGFSPRFPIPAGSRTFGSDIETGPSDFSIPDESRTSSSDIKTKPPDFFIPDGSSPRHSGRSIRTGPPDVSFPDANKPSGSGSDIDSPDFFIPDERKPFGSNSGTEPTYDFSLPSGSETGTGPSDFPPHDFTMSDGSRPAGIPADFPRPDDIFVDLDDRTFYARQNTRRDDRFSSVPEVFVGEALKIPPRNPFAPEDPRTDAKLLKFLD